jgi:phage shock protein C
VDDRLYRSTTDRSIAGVCGGVAAWLGLDPSIVRIVWVLLAFMSGGIFVLVYIVMAIVVPDAPPGWTPRGRQSPPPGAVWGPGWGGGAPGGAWSGTPSGGQQGTAAPGTGGAPVGSPAGSAQGGMPSSWPQGWDHGPGAWNARHRGDQAGIVLGVVLVALGVWFLVRDYVPVNWDLVWPVAIIALGGLLIAGAVQRTR